MKWITINNELPPSRVHVLICDHDDAIIIAAYNRKTRRWYTHSEYEIDAPRYWMRLPLTPNELTDDVT